MGANCFFFEVRDLVTEETLRQRDWEIGWFA